MSNRDIMMNNYTLFDTLYKSGDLENTKKFCLKLDDMNLENIIYEICSKHDLQRIQWLYSINLDFTDCDYSPFEIACLYSGYDIITWLHGQGHIRPDNIYHMAQIFNKTDDLSLLCWLHNLLNFNVNIQNLLFLKGSLEIKKWAYGLGNIEQMNLRDKFIWYSEQDNLADPSNILKIIQWIYSLNDLNITKSDWCSLFKYACSNNIELAKWIYGITDIHNSLSHDIDYDWNAIMKSACCNNLETAKWVYSLPGVNKINILWNDILWVVCMHRQPNKLDIADWICSLTDINIRSDNDKLFNFNCYWNNTDTLIWLTKICKNYKYTPETGYTIISDNLI